MFDLKGKVAIVTGSRRGIGRGIALVFAKAGADVVVTDIDLVECQKVSKEIEKVGRRTLAVKCDVSSAKEVDELVKKTLEKFSRIDILVNNAGIYFPKSLVETTDEEWERIINVNLKGVFLCSRAVVKDMLKRKEGRIINISSIAGEVGYPYSSAYSASKGGIIGFTKALATELSPLGINVNAIAPGAINTPMSQGVTQSEEAMKAMLAAVPRGRIGEPEDIASAALFLASDEADYVTGVTLNVDGGWVRH